MNVISVALAANFSAVLSLLGLDTNGRIGFGVSVAETSSDGFILYGTLDAAAVDSSNAWNLGAFTGGAGNLPRGIAEQAKTWPFLLVQRTSGSTAGSLFVAGNPAASPAVVSTAAPVVAGNYSALMTLTTLGAENIRLGGSAAMTSSDVFDVFVSNDSALASSAGAEKVARICGGGGDGSLLNTALFSGYNYAIIQRVSGTTAGNIIAAGVSPSTGGGVLNLTTLSVGNTAASGNIGTPPLTAAQSVDIYSSFLLTQTTASVVATLPSPTITTAGKVALVMNASTATQPIVMYGMTINVGAVQLFEWTGAAWVGGKNITQNGNAFGAAMLIGTLDNQDVTIGRNGSNIVTATATATTLGQAGATTTSVQCGTGGANIAADATDHPVTVGSLTGASAATIQAGTDGVSLVAASGGNVNLSPVAGSVVISGSIVDNTSVAVTDGTGSLGTAATTVDIASVLYVNQTTPVITYANMRLIQPPTNAVTKGRRIVICNVGTAAFTVGDATQKQGCNLTPGTTPGGAASADKGNSVEFIWNGTAWVPLSGSCGDPIQAGTANTTGNTPRAGRFTEYQITNIAAGDVTLTCTLTGALIGDIIHFARSDANAHTATINNNAGSALFVMPNSKKNFCQVRYNGSDWEYLSGGTQ